MPIVEIFGNFKNVKLALVTGIHGDETSPINALKNISYWLNDTLVNSDIGIKTIIANVSAIQKHRRFIAKDLNRVWGQIKGNSYEEQLAKSLFEELKDVPIIADFHTTHFDVKPYAIIKKYSKKIDQILKVLGIEDCIIVDFNALINIAEVGIGFETGKNGDLSTSRISEQLMKDLTCFVTEQTAHEYKLEHVNYYTVTGKISISDIQGYKKFLKDFKLVKKGDIIGFNQSGESILADKDFYPLWVNHHKIINILHKINLVG